MEEKKESELYDENYVAITPKDVKPGDPVIIIPKNRANRNIGYQMVQVDKLGRIYVYKNTLKSIGAKPGDWVKVTVEKVE